MPTVLSIIIIINTDYFLRSISVLLFLMETKYVLYEVGTVFLYRCAEEGGAMAQTRTFLGGGDAISTPRLPFLVSVKRLNSRNLYI
jgi:hypothetical protein